MCESDPGHIIYTSRHCLSIMRLGTTTATGSATPATVLTREVASRALAARSSALSTTTATAWNGASATSVIGTGLVATGLDHDGLAVDGVRVGSNCGLGGFRGLELNERTVLCHVSFNDSVIVEGISIPSGG
jgi:hypothetical protein